MLATPSRRERTLTTPRRAGCTTQKVLRQQYALVGDGKTQNSLTSVSTDTMVIKLKDKEMQDKETTLDGYSFDIRKLTPRECLRLMDVDDRHIDALIGARETMKNGKERQAISNSALYRLAGNSIVVNCMTLMFENLLYPDTEPTTGDQLKLF